ncbi:MAG: hypothetical protein ACTSYD_05640 [Candidatus Heimdallarchaeaceae archaeon]
MAFEVLDLIDLAILVGFFYLASVIISASMFSRSAKKWSWLNLIMSVLISLIWYLGTPWGINLALFGLILVLVTYVFWTAFNEVSPNRAFWAATLTVILWMAFCWLLIEILTLFKAESFIDEISYVASASLFRWYFG